MKPFRLSKKVGNRLGSSSQKEIREETLSQDGKASLLQLAFLFFGLEIRFPPFTLLLDFSSPFMYD